MLRAVNDRLKFAIKILEGAVEGQVSVDGLVVANQLISEAIVLMTGLIVNYLHITPWVFEVGACKSSS